MSALFGLGYAEGVAGHVPGATDAPPTLATAWTLAPLVLVTMLLAALLYGLGLRALWRHRVGHGVAIAQAVAFVAGWLVLALALIWPLDAMGSWLLSAHMAQHMLLLALAPPLLLLGLPGPVCLAALPTPWARGLMRPLRRPVGRRTWQVAASPMFAMLFQAAVMWSWHLPAAMALALRNAALHDLMHVSFFAAGLLFWAALFRSLREPTLGAGGGALAIVGTMIQMGLLGALMTFADAPRFAHYLERAPEFGLSPLEDQQLAGLIMWVPAAVPYLVGGLILAAAWLRRAERVGR